MQTQVTQISKLLLALLGVSSLAAAQSPAPAVNPAAAGPSFSASDQIPNPKGFGDAYSLDEIRLGGQALSEQQQVDRWQAELAAGRARAGTLSGAYFSYRALTPTDCDAARAALVKGDELGSDQAPWLLAQLAANDTCGPLDRAARERWLKTSVPLDYPSAAISLIRFYGNSAAPADQQQRYVYARVAAGYWESSTSTAPREGFDTTALQEMEKTLSAADRSGAEAEAARILEQMLKRHERFVPAKPAEFARGDAGGKTGYVGWQSDYRHECAWNLKNNCRGAQRLAYVDLTNKNAEFLSCKIELRARDFVTGAPVAEPLTRQVTDRAAGDAGAAAGRHQWRPEGPGAAGPIARRYRKLAANVTAGMPRAPAGQRRRGAFLSRIRQEPRRRGQYRGALLAAGRVGRDHRRGDREFQRRRRTRPGGNRNRAQREFTRECDYGLSSIRISFKLAQ
jgi:hypothetical protein